MIISRRAPIPHAGPHLLLAAPARRFAALMPLNKNNRGHGPETSHHESKWLERKAEPPKHEK